MGKVKNQKINIKTASFRSVLIFAIFLVTLMGLLAVLWSRLGDSSQSMTKQELINVTSKGAERINAEIFGIRGVVAEEEYLMQRSIIQDDGNDISYYAGALVASGNVYEAYILDENGQGVNQDGIEVDMSSCEVWTDIKAGSKSVYTYLDENGEGNVIYCRNAEDASGKQYIIVACYSKQAFLNDADKTGFDNQTLYILINKNGDIIYSNETQSKILEYSNLYEAIESGSTDDTRFFTNLKAGAAAYGNIEIGGEERVLVSETTCEEELKFVTAVNKSYCTYRTGKNNSAAKKVIKVIYVTICVFLLIMLFVVGKERIQNRKDKKSLEEKADTDLLTGLNNKLATERKIKEYMEIHSGTPGMLMIVDVDDFKKINDTKGHAFGDAVLKSLGEGLSGQFRYTDIVGRVGGDEFMIFLKNIEGEDNIRREAEKIIRFFDEFVAGTEYIKYSATASIGAALYPSEGADFEELYKSADKALYKSKKKGKRQLNFVNDEWEEVKV